MSEKIELLTDQRIQVKNIIFDFDEVYKHAHNWLEWYKYDVYEAKYTEKVKPQGKEFEIKWEAIRDIDEYSRFVIKVKWQLFGINDVKVQQAGQDIKMNQGEINIFITAYIVTDYEDAWEKSPFFKFLKGFYDKYLYKSTLEQLKGELWKEGWDFYNELKSFLNLYQYR